MFWLFQTFHKWQVRLLHYTWKNHWSGKMILFSWGKWYTGTFIRDYFLFKFSVVERTIYIRYFYMYVSHQNIWNWWKGFMGSAKKSEMETAPSIRDSGSKWPNTLPRVFHFCQGAFIYESTPFALFYYLTHVSDVNLSCVTFFPSNLDSKVNSNYLLTFEVIGHIFALCSKFLFFKIQLSSIFLLAFYF